MRPPRRITAALSATRFEHDSAGRETARVLPGTQRETKSYDTAGQLHSHTDFLGQTTTWSYDDAGRVEAVDYPTDADASFAYTATGQRAIADSVHSKLRSLPPRVVADCDGSTADGYGGDVNDLAGRRP